MNIAVKNTSLNENTLIWAVICSILLHILFFVVVPNVKFEAIKKLPDVLKVELVQPKKPAPIVVPEPPKPELPNPEAAKPFEKIKSLPKPIKPPPKDLPKLRPKPESQPAPAEPPPPPTVIVAAPKNESPPVFTTPPPEPPKEKPDNDDAYSAAKKNYISGIQKEIQHNLRYPNRLKMHHVTGRAIVGYSLDNEGNVTSVSIVSSSGNDILDTEAMDVIRRSNLKQYMNKILFGRIDYLTTPVSFKLPEE